MFNRLELLTPGCLAKREPILTHGANTYNQAMNLIANHPWLEEIIQLNPAEHEQFRLGTELHDLGKMLIPDNIYFKPRKLTENEWKIMRAHPALALELLGINFIDKNPFASSLILYHHPEYGNRRRQFSLNVSLERRQERSSTFSSKFLACLIILVTADKITAAAEPRTYNPLPDEFENVLITVDKSIKSISSLNGEMPPFSVNDLNLKTLYSQACQSLQNL